MAWFHKSLKDMKRAIEQEDWEKVTGILQQHNRCLDNEAPEVKHDISELANRVSQYSADIVQISLMLESQMKGKNNKALMLSKVESAINQAFFFEKIIIRLIKEHKFMK